MKHRLYLYLVWILLPVVTAVRTWQLHSAIDTAGFYLESYATLCNILEMVLLAIVVALLFFGRFFMQTPLSVTPPKQSLSLGIAALVLSFSAVVQASIDWTSDGNLLSLVPGFLTALGFTVVGASHLQGKKPAFGAAVIPIVGELLRLILSYAHFNGIAQISENVLHILFMCSFLAFCLAHSRITTGIGNTKGVAWLYGTAAATGIFGLCASLPHWMMGQNQSTLSVMGFGAAVYAVVYMTLLITKPAAGESPVLSEPTVEE